MVLFTDILQLMFSGDYWGVRTLDVLCCKIDKPALTCQPLTHFRDVNVHCKLSETCTAVLQTGIDYGKKRKSLWEGFEGVGLGKLSAWQDLEPMFFSKNKSLELNNDTLRSLRMDTRLRTTVLYTTKCRGRLEQLVLLCNIKNTKIPIYTIGTSQNRCV